ncbi:hypothetical protein LIER_35831 [Lithospermum erythrorhizon]|uniref:DYW domain-containing protein n=1 Tax=Lithospermum erythrorhizon TaxID=34254 RepID=A0AAV3NY52_LITER
MEVIKLVSLHYFNQSPFFQQSITKKQQNYAGGNIHCNVEEAISHTPVKSFANHSFFDDLTELHSLNFVKSMHAQVIKSPKELNSQRKMESLIKLYLDLGDFWSATTVFFVGLIQNFLSWRSFVDDFRGFGGTPNEILEVFVELHNRGVIFDSKLLTIGLKICATIEEKCLGLELHACLIKRGFNMDEHLICSLMNFYGRCWDIEEANKAFSEMPTASLLWNEVVLINLRNAKWLQGLKMFSDMQCSFVKANDFTVAKVLQACSELGYLNGGRQIHGYVIRNNLGSDTLVCNTLIHMYAKNNDLKHARNVFDLMINRNLSSWNSIISAYGALGYLIDAWELFDRMEALNTKPDIITWNSLMSGHVLNGSCKEVFTILRKMQSLGYKPNSVSCTSALQAVSKLSCLNLGKEIHSFIIRNELDYDLHLGSSLVDMYVKNDDLTAATVLVKSMKRRNIFAWNSLISGYSLKGRFEEAVDLFDRMKNEGVKPDLVTYNSLISGYAVWGCIKEALATIRLIKMSGLAPNVVSWTAIISGCIQNGYYKEALDISRLMQEGGIKPNLTTVLSLLSACTGLSLLQKGKEVHCLSIRYGFTDDVYITTALIDMYSKSGSLTSAYDNFRRVQMKTLAVFNSMIMGFAIYSSGKEAISLFDELCKLNIKPDAITFTALLSCCKNSGLITEGWNYFDSMKDFGIAQTIEHYSCMVDLLGRVGYLDEAWDFIQTMPMEPDASVWGAFLASCRLHGNIELGERAIEKLYKLEPYNAVNYVMMMNLYSSANRWDDVDRIRNMVSAKGLKIGYVWSWIQINHEVHVFSSSGKCHGEEGEIYFELYKLISQMKSMGYEPDTKCVYQKMEVEEKEKVLLTHTEKLAVTYGLIKTKGGAPIRVINNTRVCSDCHTVVKYMSFLRKREIFLKDGVRFHHFKDGKCSCNDLW